MLTKLCNIRQIDTIPLRRRWRSFREFKKLISHAYV